MGEKTIRGRKRFQFETEEERDKFEKARDYFGSSTLLLKLGCGYDYASRNSGSAFVAIKNGVDRGYIRTIPLETWKKIQEYASRFDREERYDPQTFRPIIDI